MLGSRGALAQPHVVDAVRGGGPIDRAHVERSLHAVEDQPQPGRDVPTPVAVQPLQLGRRQLPRSVSHVGSPAGGRPVATRGVSSGTRSRPASEPGCRPRGASAPPAAPPRRTTGAPANPAAGRGAPASRCGSAGSTTRRARPGRRAPPRATTTRTLVSPAASAFAWHSSRARRFTSTAHTTDDGARVAIVNAIGPYPHPRSTRSPDTGGGGAVHQQVLGAGVDPGRGEDAAVGLQLEGHVDQLEADRGRRRRDARLSVEVVTGATSWARVAHGRNGSLVDMAPYAIRIVGDPVLRERAQDVTEIDARLVRLIDDMFVTMYDAPGVGLAAPQVGVQKRFFVYDTGEDPKVLINPQITGSDGEWYFEEGLPLDPRPALRDLPPEADRGLRRRPRRQRGQLRGRRVPGPRRSSTSSTTSTAS